MKLTAGKLYDVSHPIFGDYTVEYLGPCLFGGSPWVSVKVICARGAKTLDQAKEGDHLSANPEECEWKEHTREEDGKPNAAMLGLSSHMDLMEELEELKRKHPKLWAEEFHVGCTTATILLAIRAVPLGMAASSLQRLRILADTAELSAKKRQD